MFAATMFGAAMLGATMLGAAAMFGVAVFGAAMFGRSRSAGSRGGPLAHRYESWVYDGNAYSLWPLISRPKRIHKTLKAQTQIED